MKTFLLKAVLFFLACAIAGIAIIITLGGKKYDAGRIPVRKLEIASHTTQPIGLVLGSSHGFFDINSTAVDTGMYNMASVSQSIREDYAVLLYQARRRKVTSVVLPISYFSNFMSLAQRSEDGERVRMFDYINAYNIHYSPDIKYFQSGLTYLSLLARSIIKGAGFADSVDNHGNLIDTCTGAAYDISDSTIAFQRHNAYESINFKDLNPYLDSILHLCGSSHIKLTMIAMPVTKGYRNAVARGTHALEYEQFLNRLKGMQSADVKFIDCREFFPSGEQAYFKDADHLSPCGRNKFSEYLRNVILK